LQTFLSENIPVSSTPSPAQPVLGWGIFLVSMKMKTQQYQFNAVAVGCPAPRLLPVRSKREST
ncbi:hypothetical protein, partial [Pseudomonas savastanoi]|uniref:hypothetical protein n=1 Tax=Pseudomonas savastanoi TaxID=29438 RepID=UPI001C8050FB